MHDVFTGNAGALADEIDKGDDNTDVISIVKFICQCPSVTCTHIMHSLETSAPHNATVKLSLRPLSNLALWQSMFVWQGCMLSVSALQHVCRA